MTAPAPGPAGPGGPAGVAELAAGAGLGPGAALALVAVLVVLAGFGLFAVWNHGARAGRRMEHGLHTITRAGAGLGRALVGGVVIGGIQWAVLASTAAPLAWGLVLGVPALLAAASASRLVAVRSLAGHGGRLSGRHGGFSAREVRHARRGGRR